MVLYHDDGYAECKFMLAFLACYALYGILLTLTAYFSRIYTIDQRLFFSRTDPAIVACF